MAGSFSGKTQSFEVCFGCSIHSPAALGMLDGNEHADCESVGQVFESLTQYQFKGVR